MTMIDMPKGRVTSDAGFGVASDSAQPYGRKWLFSFGVYGRTRVLVVGADPSLEDALEIAAEWCAKYAPGVFSEPDYEDAARELGLQWSPRLTALDTECLDAIGELAERDHTYTESGWLLSWEWTCLQDPPRETLLQLDGRA